MTFLWKSVMLTLSDFSFLLVTPGKDVDRLRGVYDSIRAEYPKNEIVIVYDNNTAAILNSDDENLIEVSTDHRVYVSEGYNLALYNCSKKCFVFLHDDTFIAKNFLENIIPNVTETQFCNFVTVEPPLYNEPDTIQKPIKNFGRSISEFDLNAFNQFCEQRIKLLPKDIFESPYGGFFMAGYKSSIDAIGGFDITFKPYFFEDADLMLRMHMAGYNFVLACNSLVYHMGSLTSRGTKESDEAMQTTSKLFVLKWKVAWEMARKYTLDNGIPYRYIPAKIVAHNSNTHLDEYINLISTDESNITVEFDANKLTPTAVEYLQSLSYILQSIEDIGVYEIENFTIHFGSN